MTNIDIDNYAQNLWKIIISLEEEIIIYLKKNEIGLFRYSVWITIVYAIYFFYHFVELGQLLGDLTSIVFMIGIAVLLAIVHLVWRNIKRRFEDKLNALIEQHYILLDSMHDIWSISELLQFTNNLELLFQEVKSYNFWKEFLKNEIDFICSLLLDASSILHGKISDKIMFIKNWKNQLLWVHWTTDLNQVSALQQSRLDKQIEQFEELQRVLVKA